MLKEYSFVLDKKGQKLDPTIIQNAWRLIRQKKAKLVSKFPMVIQLNKVIENPDTSLNKKEFSEDELLDILRYSLNFEYKGLE